MTPHSVSGLNSPSPSDDPPAAGIQPPTPNAQHLPIPDNLEAWDFIRLVTLDRKQLLERLNAGRRNLAHRQRVLEYSTAQALEASQRELRVLESMLGRGGPVLGEVPGHSIGFAGHPITDVEPDPAPESGRPTTMRAALAGLVAFVTLAVDADVLNAEELAGNRLLVDAQAALDRVGRCTELRRLAAESAQHVGGGDLDSRAGDVLALLREVAR